MNPTVLLAAPPTAPVIPLGPWAEVFIEFLTNSFAWLFDGLRAVFGGLYDLVALALAAPPFWAVIVVFALLGLLLRGWLFAAGTAAGLTLVVLLGQWGNAMDTLALVLVASAIAIVVSVPLGILAARSSAASAVIRPVLDFMQTMPAFVYLIPALILFRVGIVPGIVATIVFAMAPGVRMTELGIRGVDKEVVEAANAFGSSRGRILRQIQLPLAMPTILAGINQVIMLSLSMVVIAGMVGAGGLGGEVVKSLGRIDVALGFEAGLSVVVLAIILDRMTAALGLPRKRLFPAGMSPRARVATRSAFGALALAAAALLAFSSFAAPAAAVLENGDKKDLKIAVFNGWDEGIAASELWKAILEEKGYAVSLEYADVAPVYSGLSTDDYDVVLDTWLPVTHADYMDSYGDNLVDLGAWNTEAKLTIAVNADAPIDSLDELAANAELFGNRLVGIEPGAGLTGVTNDAVIPGYGLEGMEYLTSSTPAMLSELKAATDAGENIAVTLWQPHWAYDAFPVKNLEDPQGLLGEAEGVHSIGGKSFEGNFPTLSGWLKVFTLDTERLASLENAMFNSDSSGSDHGPAVAEWISENQEYVDSLTQ